MTVNCDAYGRMILDSVIRTVMDLQGSLLDDPLEDEQ